MKKKKNPSFIPHALGVGASLLAAASGIGHIMAMNPVNPPVRMKNPVLKKGKRVTVNRRPLRDVPTADVSENMLIVKIGGGFATEILGYHPEEHILYFVEDPKSIQILLDAAKSTDKNADPLPFFMLRRPIGGIGTLDQFWKNKIAKKYLAVAIQFFVEDDKIVLCFMTVKPKYRRNRLNTHMIAEIIREFPGKELFFHEPTKDGWAFMKQYGGKEIKL